MAVVPAQHDDQKPAITVIDVPVVEKGLLHGITSPNDLPQAMLNPFQTDHVLHRALGATKEE